MTEDEIEAANLAELGDFFAQAGNEAEASDKRLLEDAALLDSVDPSHVTARETVPTKDRACRMCCVALPAGSITRTIRFGWKRKWCAFYYCGACQTPREIARMDEKRREKYEVTTAILVRVSTDKQTTDAQRLQLEAWARANAPEGVEWYPEDGVSGVSKKRPVRDTMLQACREGRHKVVAVAALDRIGRNASELVSILAELKSLGVRVVSLREGLDFSTTVGQMVGSVLAFVAQIERENTGERTRLALASAKAQGKKLGRPSWEISPAELERVRSALEKGESLSSVLRGGVRATRRKFKLTGRGPRGERLGEWSDVEGLASREAVERALKR